MAQLRPTIFAHRGASAYAPENTFASFDLARQMGAPAVETDVRITRDGVLLLMHDATVDRTTNGHGPVADLTASEVLNLDAGVSFGQQFTGQRVPTLEQYLARYGDYPVCIEIKAPDIERRVIDSVAAARLAIVPTFTAFEFSTVENLCRLDSSLTVGYLSHTFDSATIAKVRDVGARQICPKASDLTPQLIDEARAAGLEVRAWGVGDDATLERAIRLGVDGLTTNWPDRGLALVNKYYP